MDSKLNNLKHPLKIIKGLKYPVRLAADETPQENIKIMPQCLSETMKIILHIINITPLTLWLPATQIELKQFS